MREGNGLYTNGEFKNKVTSDLAEIRDDLKGLEGSVTLLTAKLSEVAGALLSLSEAIKTTRDSISLKALTYFVFLLLACLYGVSAIKDLFHFTMP